MVNSMFLYRTGNKADSVEGYEEMRPVFVSNSCGPLCSLGEAGRKSLGRLPGIFTGGDLMPISLAISLSESAERTKPNMWKMH